MHLTVQQPLFYLLQSKELQISSSNLGYFIPNQSAYMVLIKNSLYEPLFWGKKDRKTLNQIISEIPSRSNVFVEHFVLGYSDGFNIKLSLVNDYTFSIYKRLVYFQINCLPSHYISYPTEHHNIRPPLEACDLFS